MKKVHTIALCMTLLLLCVFSGCKPSADTPAATDHSVNDGNAQSADSRPSDTNTEYPSGNLSGIISFNPGGATDIMGRIIGPEMEKIYGQSVVMENVPGASGATATEGILAKPADGSNILFTSEVCVMWQALAVSDIDCLTDLTPIMVYGGSAGVLVTQPNFPHDTYEDIIRYAKEHPGQLSVASAGIGTNIDAYVKMMEVIHDIELNVVTYGSEGDCRTALLGGEVDFTICNNFTALSYMQDGSFVCKAIFGDEEIAGYEGSTILCDAYEAYNQYLPWGSFIASFVHADTDPAIVESLVDANVQAYQSDAFQTYLDQNGVLGYGLTGKDAQEYIANSRSIVWYLYYDTGNTDRNPADFGVERAG